MIKNLNILLAKLTEKQYKPYKELYESMKEEYDKRYDHIFGVGNMRLYLDDEIKIDYISYLESIDIGNAYYCINTIFYICDKFYYYKNAFIDFASNRVYDKNNREYKLTKILSLIINKKLKHITEEQYEKIDKQLQQYKFQFNKDLLVDYTLKLPPKSILSDDGIILNTVISRDPYDIVGMSTDRRWKSCMSLPSEKYPKGGAFYDKLYNDIKLGTVVAYLVEKTDKNIEKPYARIAIKPYMNISDQTITLFKEPKIYHDGSLGKESYTQFDNIIQSFLDSIQDNKEGVFVILPSLYNDSDSTFKIKTSKGHTFDKVLNFNKLFELDSKGIRKIINLLVKPTSKNNKIYIEKFKRTILLYNRLKLNLSIPIIDIIYDENLTIENYYNKNITIKNTENNKTEILAFSDLIHITDKDILSTAKNKIKTKDFNDIVNEMKNNINYIENNAFEYENNKSYDMYILDNKLNDNINSTNSIISYEGGYSATAYLTNAKETERINEAYSIYICNSNEKLNNYIMRFDININIDIEYLINNIQDIISPSECVQFMLVKYISKDFKEEQQNNNNDDIHEILNMILEFLNILLITKIETSELLVK